MFLVFGGVEFSLSQAWADEPPTRTKADTNREVIRTYAEIYLEAKNYELAEKTLAQYLATEDQDPVLWNLMGITQIAQKKYAQGCFGFKKAAELFPVGEDKANSLYGFADCLMQGGKLEDSKQVLKAMVEQGGPGKVAAESALEKIKDKEIIAGKSLPPFEWQKRGRLHAAAALTAGYDTNVLLVDDITASTGTVSNQGSAFITPTLQMGYWGNIFNQRYDTRFIASFTDYLSQSAKSYNLMYERLDFMVGSSDVRVGVIQEMAFINRDPFQLYFVNAGLMAQKRKRRTQTEEIDFELPVEYRYYYFDRTALPENVRTGIEVGAKIQYLRIYNDDIRFSSSLGVKSDFSTGRNYRLLDVSWPTSVLLPLPGFKALGLTNSFGFELGGQDYFQSDVSRRDWDLKLGAGLMRDLFKGCHMVFDYSYQKDSSNLDAARYKKHLVTLSLSYDLL